MKEREEYGGGRRVDTSIRGNVRRKGYCKAQESRIVNKKAQDRCGREGGRGNNSIYVRESMNNRVGGKERAWEV